MNCSYMDAVYGWSRRYEGDASTDAGIAEYAGYEWDTPGTLFSFRQSQDLVAGKHNNAEEIWADNTV